MDPAESPTRRLMFELFAQEKRIRTVARILNDRGYRTRSGSQFTDTAVARLLSDPAPEIVPSDLWEQCQTLLRQRAEREAPRKRPVHLFTGLTFCRCGGQMRAPVAHRRQYECPICQQRVPADVLELAFQAKLADYSLPDGELEEYTRELAASLPKIQELRNSVDAERLRIDSEIDALAAAHRGRKVSEAALQVERAPLIARRDELARECARLDESIEFAREQAHGPLPQGVGSLPELWPSLNPAEKRSLIEQICRRIEIGDGQICFTLLTLPSRKDAEDARVEQRVDPVQHDAPTPQPVPVEQPVALPAVAPSKRQRSRSVPASRPFLTLAEIAADLGIDRTTVYRLVNQGEIASHRVGRQIRVRRDDFEAYVASRREPTVAEQARPTFRAPVLPSRGSCTLDEEQRGLELARKHGTTKR